MTRDVSSITRYPSARRSDHGRAIRTALFGGVVALGATLAIAPAAPSAATKAPAPPTTGYALAGIQAQDPAAQGRWGERMAAAGDLNGDGVNDVWVGDNHAAPTGKVYALDGAAAGRATRNVLYTLTPPGDAAALHINNFGTYIANIGDVNGDGVNDVAVGVFQDEGTVLTSLDPQANQGSGKVWVFSGKASDHANGATGLLYGIDAPFPQTSDSFPTRITRAGDINQDGFPDIMISATTLDQPVNCSKANPPVTPCSAAQGQVYIFSGKPADHVGMTTGLLRTLDMPAADVPTGGCKTSAPNECHFGVTLEGPGDVNGDGVPDQVVDAGYLNNRQGRLYVFSGSDGSLLGRIDSPAPQDGAFFGFADTSPMAPGDINGDHKADIYGGSFTQNDQGITSAGEAWVFSGAGISPAGTPASAVITTLHDPSPEDGGQFGWSMTTVASNLNGAGTGTVPDLYVGKAPHHGSGSTAGGNGGTYVMDATTGKAKRALELPLQYRQTTKGFGNLAPAMGWSIAALGDINGDGIDDYLAGAPFYDQGANANQGLIVASISQPETNVAAVVGGDNNLYVKRNGGTYQKMGGILIAAPAVVAVPTGAITPPAPLYIVEGSNHRLYVRNDTASANPDSDYRDFAPNVPVGCYGTPAATITPDGAGGYTLTVACTGGDQGLYYWQTPVTSASLPQTANNATGLGGTLIAGPAVAPVNSVVTFFAEGTDHYLYSRTAAATDPFTGNSKINAQCNGSPAAGTNGLTTYLTCQGLDGSVYYSSNVAGQGWAPFKGAGGQVIEGPGIAVTTSGETIYAEGLDFALYHTNVDIAAANSNGFTPDYGQIKYGAGATGPSFTGPV